MAALRKKASPVKLTVVRGEPPPPVGVQRRASQRRALLFTLVVALLALIWAQVLQPTWQSVRADWATDAKAARNRLAKLRKDQRRQERQQLAAQKLMDADLKANKNSQVRKALEEPEEELPPPPPRRPKMIPDGDAFEVNGMRFVLDESGKPLRPAMLRRAIRENTVMLARIGNINKRWAKTIEGDDMAEFVNVIRKMRDYGL
jgi:hypothetical protein